MKNGVNTIAQYTVIADVGITIVQLLRDNMVNEPIQQPEFIGLSHPNDKGDLSLSLFLYSVKESADQTNPNAQQRAEHLTISTFDC